MAGNDFATFADPMDFIYLCAAGGCIICAALAAGMTMGLLSLDSLKLRIKLVVGTPAEKAAARKILPLIENHHFLLCTLLLYNALANEALPVFLDEIVPSWAAIIISVTMVLICGEIIPTALFTGPNQLAIASKFSGLVYFLQVIFYPIAKPMSLGLDHMLGVEEEENLNRDEISAMLQILRDSKAKVPPELAKYAGSGGYNSGGDDDSHNPMQSRDSDTEDPLSTNEVNVITGVLALAKKTIKDVYTPLDKVNMLSADQILDAECMEAIDKVGHSRLPVFQGTDNTHILGFLLVKRLITINPEKNIPLSTIQLHQPIVVGAHQSLLDVLNLFQLGSSHLALVSEHPEELQYHLMTNTPPKMDCRPIGILSIEDIFEEMIQSEIYDEEDYHKGHDQEHASMHLRDLSMRSSLMNSSIGGGGANVELVRDIESALASPKGVSPKHVSSPAIPQKTRQYSITRQAPHKAADTVERKRQISVNIVEQNTRANAALRQEADLPFKRSMTHTGARAAQFSETSEDDNIKDRCLSASTSGPNSFLRQGETGHKITASMVTKYIKRRKSAAALTIGSVTPPSPSKQHQKQQHSASFNENPVHPQSGEESVYDPLLPPPVLRFPPASPH